MAEKKTFEQSISELEEIVSQLENGDVTLDESLSLFERGIKLSKSCQKMLDAAEKKVSILLTNDDGEIEKQEFAELEEQI
jgi:exodeoxyribonuclease VII small subunit